jgi:hypothetical protein
MADNTNPLTHPEVMKGKKPVMDADKTTHPEAKEQDYNLLKNPAGNKSDTTAS